MELSNTTKSVLYACGGLYGGVSAFIAFQHLPPYGKMVSRDVITNKKSFINCPEPNLIHGIKRYIRFNAFELGATIFGIIGATWCVGKLIELSFKK